MAGKKIRMYGGDHNALLHENEGVVTVIIASLPVREMSGMGEFTR